MENKETIDVSVILPIHELDDQTKKLFGLAIESVKIQQLRPITTIIVTPKGSDTCSFLKEFDYGDYKDNVIIIENEDKTDFASQVNLGIENTKTEWFSILDFDDEYARYWFKNVNTYIEAYQDVDIFLPIVVNVDEQNMFTGLINEAVWANSFSDKLGFLDNNALLSYQNFVTHGMVMKKSVYDEFGGIKSNIKFTTIYEFLLRMTLKDATVMVIPRYGYKHMNKRVGSISHGYLTTLDPVEAKWWVSVAKKESFFKKDRELTYSNELS